MRDERTSASATAVPNLQVRLAVLDNGDWVLERFYQSLRLRDGRQAHNLKVIGSNPIPATKYHADNSALS
jgi:hypothetical protein